MAEKSSIVYKSVLGFISVILLFAGFGVASLIEIREISKVARNIYDHPLVVSNSSLLATLSVAKMHRSMKDVVLFDSPSRINTAIREMEEQERLVFKNLDVVKNNILGDEGRELENETRRVFVEWEPIRDEVIGFARRQQRDKAAEITAGKGADHVVELEKRMLALTSYARDKATAFMQYGEEVRSRVAQTSIVLMAVGISLSIFVAFFTIRQAQSAERALRDSEEKYRAMMEAMVDPVYICSSEFRVMYMNPAMIQRTGRDATGEICHKAIHDLDERCPFCVHDRVQQGEHVEDEILSPKDGRFYLGSHSPVIHSDGSISKMTIYKDITEHKRADEALEKARLELEQRVMERTFELTESNERLKQEIAERLQTELALQNSEAELRRLSSRLLNAQEEERKRIARELHDGIGQSLSAIKFTVETALNEMAQENPAQVVESLETVVPVVKGAVEEVRTISRNLRPSVLDDLGILATISWFCREIENTYSGIRINRQIRIEEGDVPADLKTVIFRLLQEAVNNVTKHSQATVIDLFLEGRNGKIELTIKDNGIGFDLEQVVTEGRVKDGIGLSSMRERTELSNGSFLIKSQKGTGTTVHASWPLSEAKD
jgi:PAS domain S-box-containing protein